MLVKMSEAQENGSPVQVFAAAWLNRRAKDGSLSAADGLAGVGRLVGRWIARAKPLAVVADHHRHPGGSWPTERMPSAHS